MSTSPSNPRIVALLLFAIAVAELAILFWRRPRQVDLREAAATVVVAVGHNFSVFATRSMFGGLFLYVWDHRLYTMPLNRWWAWAALLLLSEFAYYWQHRLSHTRRWFWASHAVHHSSRHLNLFAAFRLAWTGALSGLALLFVPLILVGYSPLSIGIMLAINLLYQLWLHNEWMPRLGPIEWIFNTPSHHRVHHATNPQYIDRNYGGILIIFDRLFGTYALEEEACRYGLAHGVPSYNPIRIALGEWGAMVRDIGRSRSLRDGWHVLFGPPGSGPARPESVRTSGAVLIAQHPRL